MSRRSGNKLAKGSVESLRHVNVDSMESDELDIELNRHGFRGMTQRPTLRNVFDSKQDRINRLKREK